MTRQMEAENCDNECNEAIAAMVLKKFVKRVIVRK
jgi:hypothetical protein